MVLATEGSRDIHRAALRAVRGGADADAAAEPGRGGAEWAVEGTGSGCPREDAPGKVTNRDRGRLEGGMLLKGAGW